MIRGSIPLVGSRHLDYFEIGPRDAPVVLYCHGTPGSRFELLLAEPELRRSDVSIRLVGLNRPGYGTSSFVDQQGFLPWARDVEEAADRLGIDRFSVLGASGGSPFALACALSLADRIQRVGIVAGVAPPDTPGMEQSAALADESASKIVRSVRYGTLSLGVRLGLTRRLVRRLIASLGTADRKAMSDSRAATAFGEIVREAFAQWGRAAVVEAGLFMRSWDFDPRLVTQETRLWHGTDDNRIPARVALEFASRLLNATCVIWPHHGHFSWAMSAADEIGSFLTEPTRDQRTG